MNAVLQQDAVTVAECKEGSSGRKLRVGISCFASDHGRSGIGQYLLNVVRRLPQLAPHCEFILFAPQCDAPLWQERAGNVQLVLEPDRFDRPIASVLWHSLRLRQRLREHACDVVFLPAGNRRLGWSYGVPSVATVHDLSQLHVPGKYDTLHMLYAKYVLPLLIARQNRVVTVSASTRTDLLAYTSLTERRIDIVPNGIDHERYGMERSAAQQQVSDRFGIRQPYLLYVARLEHPGKNHVTLLHAYSKMRAQGITQRLVLAGPRWPGAEAIDAKIAELGLLEHVDVTGFIPADALPALYAAADAMVFPSHYEGFGIPLLEAMASGIPICTSNTSSLPEVAREAALYFDPADPDDIAAVVCDLLRDPAMSKNLCAKGARRVRAFSWRRTALGVLRACLEVTQ